jgi:hypothetical protein
MPHLPCVPPHTFLPSGPRSCTRPSSPQWAAAPSRCRARLRWARARRRTRGRSRFRARRGEAGWNLPAHAGGWCSGHSSRRRSQRSQLPRPTHPAGCVCARHRRPRRRAADARRRAAADAASARQLVRWRTRGRRLEPSLPEVRPQELLFICQPSCLVLVGACCMRLP